VKGYDIAFIDHRGWRRGNVVGKTGAPCQPLGFLITKQVIQNIEDLQ
jgi:hypothetical protein